MRTIYKLGIFFFVLIVTACQNDVTEDIIPEKVTNDDVRHTEISLDEGNMIISPEWLANVVDSVNNLSPTGRRHPWVYSVRHNEKEYFFVCDGVNSSIANGYLYFTSSGEAIPYNSDLYNVLSAEDDRVLVWWRYYVLKQAQTKAIGDNTTWTSTSVYTPKGSLVQDTYIRSEGMTSIHEQEILDYLEINYPAAVILDEATTTYNCHAYAWHIMDGGAPVWMGKDINPTSIYWQDGSYYQTSAGGAGAKVAYIADNHSAVTTETTNYFISKWGDWPLLRHHKDDSPYISYLLSYYRKTPNFSIGGPSTITASGGYAGATLAISPTISGFSCVWSAEFYGECDRWYIWPNGNRADVSVYLNSQDSGGMLRVECKIYNGNILMGNVYHYLSVYPPNSTMTIEQKQKQEQLWKQYFEFEFLQ
ncbi:hypothetical protein LJC57_01690 [Parabacteroides sp. OttesenSCG-928-G07]|nr:hypothetical protein [Parabacteroides sp. OttesenSCG-928-G21]MDL2277281.1 hypothetical protein [Parabacteroides sp. OttesenSCG-928-G07]